MNRRRLHLVPFAVFSLMSACSQSPSGQPGPQGEQGPAGVAGPTGPRGEPGSTGATGETGPQGPAGAAGLSVTSLPLDAGSADCPNGGSAFSVGGVTTHACNGATGPAGADGAPGATGAQGPAGSAGLSVTALALDAGSVDCANGGSAFSVGGVTTYACNGATGPAGADGAMGPQGATGPQGPGFARIVIVSGTGTALQNGAALRSAINNISSPSAAAPWKVLVEPGVYDVGSSALNMRPYVDVQGSGTGVTTITANFAGGIMLALADNMLLSDLTVENTSANPSVQTYGVGNLSSSLVKLRNVVININQPTNVIFATNFTFTNVELDGVTVIALGATVGNQAFRLQNGVATIRNSILNAGGGTALMDPIGTQDTFRVVNTQLIGGVTGATRACVGAYNGSFAALNATCN